MFTSLQFRGTLLVALSGMLYGIMAYFGVQLFHQHMTVETMLFWRFLVAMLWMIIPVFILKKSEMESQISRTAMLKIIVFAAITYSGSSAFYFLACQHIGTGVAMVIFFSYPIFVTFLAWFLSKWKISKTTLLSLFAVLLGLILLKGKGENTLNILGIALGMIAALFYAVYVYGSQHTTKVVDSKLLTLLICMGNSFIFLVYSYCTGTFFIPHTFHAWIDILALGILATALPIQLLLDGLKYISPIKASILSVLEPLVTIVIGLWLLNESISFVQSLGMVIVLMGAILIQFEKSQPMNV